MALENGADREQEDPEGGVVLSATITLSADDFSAALHLATERSMESLRSGRRDSIGEDKTWIDAHKTHLVGAVGEIAFSKWSGRYPTFSTQQFSGMAPDIGTRYEIRHRLSRDFDLILREDTHPDRVYVLTRGCPPEIEIAGWCWGHEFKDRTDLTADHGGHKPAIFVPASELHPPETLP